MGMGLRCSLAGFEYARIASADLFEPVPGHLRELGVDVLDTALLVRDHHGARALLHGARKLAQIFLLGLDLAHHLVEARRQLTDLVVRADLDGHVKNARAGPLGSDMQALQRP